MTFAGNTGALFEVRVVEGKVQMDVETPDGKGSVTCDASTAMSIAFQIIREASCAYREEALKGDAKGDAGE